MIDIRVITDLKEAEEVWRSLSPNRTIFDNWDFRYCFYKYWPYPLHFYAAYDNVAGRETLVGLLPLEYNSDWQGLEYWAEDPCEENRVFIKPGYEKIIPELYAAAPARVKIYDISGQDEFTVALPIEDYKYVLPLAGLRNFEDYLTRRLTPRRARYLQADMQKVADLEPTVRFIGGGKEGQELLKKLFVFNINNFGADSYLSDQINQRAWLDLLSLPFDWRIMELKIKEELAAVSLGLIYQGEYHYLIIGLDRRFSGLGKYSARVNLEEAIRSQARIFDLGLGDCGWKQFWHFDTIPQYEFIKD